MADIFGRVNTQYGGSFPVDGAKVVVSGGGTELTGVGMLTQQLQFNYNQPISVLFEIGTNYGYIVSGRARGAATASRIVGYRSFMGGFYAKYGDVCNAGSNMINIEAKAGSCGVDLPGKSSDELATFGLNNVVIAGISGSVTSENSLFSETLQLQYLALSLD